MFRAIISPILKSTRLCLQLGVGYNAPTMLPAGSLRRGSVAVRLLRLWVGIPLGAWISVSCECCVLTSSGLFVGLIIRPEESYRLCDARNVCDREASQGGTMSRNRVKVPQEKKSVMEISLYKKNTLWLHLL